MAQAEQSQGSSLNDWLAGIQLEKYVPVIEAVGYHNVEAIIEKQPIFAMDLFKFCQQQNSFEEKYKFAWKYEDLQKIAEAIIARAKEEQDTMMAKSVKSVKSVKSGSLNPSNYNVSNEIYGHLRMKKRSGNYHDYMESKVEDFDVFKDYVWLNEKENGINQRKKYGDEWNKQMKRLGFNNIEIVDIADARFNFSCFSFDRKETKENFGVDYKQGTKCKPDLVAMMKIDDSEKFEKVKVKPEWILFIIELKKNDGEINIRESNLQQVILATVFDAAGMDRIPITFQTKMVSDKESKSLCFYLEKDNSDDENVDFILYHRKIESSTMLYWMKLFLLKCGIQPAKDLNNQVYTFDKSQPAFPKAVKFSMNSVIEINADLWHLLELDERVAYLHHIMGPASSPSV